jgi:hypothetical protein
LNRLLRQSISVEGRELPFHIVSIYVTQGIVQASGKIELSDVEIVISLDSFVDDDSTTAVAVADEELESRPVEDPYSQFDNVSYSAGRSDVSDKLNFEGTSGSSGPADSAATLRELERDVATFLGKMEVYVKNVQLVFKSNRLKSQGGDEGTITWSLHWDFFGVANMEGEAQKVATATGSSPQQNASFELRKTFSITGFVLSMESSPSAGSGLMTPPLHVTRGNKQLPITIEEDEAETEKKQIEESSLMAMSSMMESQIGVSIYHDAEENLEDDAAEEVEEAMRKTLGALNIPLTADSDEDEDGGGGDDGGRDGGARQGIRANDREEDTLNQSHVRALHSLVTPKLVILSFAACNATLEWSANHCTIEAAIPTISVSLLPFAISSTIYTILDVQNDWLKIISAENSLTAPIVQVAAATGTTEVENESELAEFRLADELPQVKVKHYIPNTLEKLVVGFSVSSLDLSLGLDDTIHSFRSLTPADRQLLVRGSSIQGNLDRPADSTTLTFQGSIASIGAELCSRELRQTLVQSGRISGSWKGEKSPMTSPEAFQESDRNEGKSGEMEKEKDRERSKKSGLGGAEMRLHHAVTMVLEEDVKLTLPIDQVHCLRGLLASLTIPERFASPAESGTKTEIANAPSVEVVIEWKEAMLTFVASNNDGLIMTLTKGVIHSESKEGNVSISVDTLQLYNRQSPERQLIRAGSAFHSPCRISLRTMPVVAKEFIDSRSKPLSHLRDLVTIPRERLAVTPSPLFSSELLEMDTAFDNYFSCPKGTTGSTDCLQVDLATPSLYFRLSSAEVSQISQNVASLHASMPEADPTVVEQQTVAAEEDGSRRSPSVMSRSRSKGPRQLTKPPSLILHWSYQETMVEVADATNDVVRVVVKFSMGHASFFNQFLTNAPLALFHCQDFVVWTGERSTILLTSDMDWQVEENKKDAAFLLLWHVTEENTFGEKSPLSIAFSRACFHYRGVLEWLNDFAAFSSQEEENEEPSGSDLEEESGSVVGGRVLVPPDETGLKVSGNNSPASVVDTIRQRIFSADFSFFLLSVDYDPTFLMSSAIVCAQRAFISLELFNVEPTVACQVSVSDVLLHVMDHPDHIEVVESPTGNMEQWLEESGYVRVMDLLSAQLQLVINGSTGVECQISEVNLNFNACCDSFQTAVTLFTITVDPEDMPKIPNTYGEPEKVEEEEDDEDGEEEEGVEREKNAAASLAERERDNDGDERVIKQSAALSRGRGYSVVSSRQSSSESRVTLPTERGSSSLLESEYCGEAEGLAIVWDYWNSASEQLMGGPAPVARDATSSLQISLLSAAVKIHIYGGRDFPQGLPTVRFRPERWMGNTPLWPMEEGGSSAPMQTVHPHSDEEEGDYVSEEEEEEEEEEGGGIPVSSSLEEEGKMRAVIIDEYFESPKQKLGRRAGRRDSGEVMGGIGRKANVSICIALSSVQGFYSVFGPTSPYAAHANFACEKFEVLDQIVASPIHHLVSFRTDQYEKLGDIVEAMRPVATFDLLIVPSSETQTSEYRMDVSLPPLRVSLHQDALEFLGKFFAHEDPFLPNLRALGVADRPFLQYFRIGQIPIVVDFVPRGLEMMKLVEGDTAQFMNLREISDLEITLIQLEVTGGYLDDIMQRMVWDWIDDILSNQTSTVTKSLIPGARSAFRVSSGVRDLFLKPLAFYQRDGRFITGVAVGLRSFLTKASSEGFEIGANTCLVMKGTLEAVDTWVTGDKPLPLRTQSDGSRAGQPVSVWQGVKRGAEALYSGVSRTGRSVTRRQRKAPQQKGLMGYVGSTLRIAPAVVLKPPIAAFEAAGTIFIGARNTLNPRARERDERKYKS